MSDQLPNNDTMTADIEQQLLSIWQKLLKNDLITRNDKFYEVGGDSLKAMQFTAEIVRRFGREVPVTNIVESTLGEIALMIAKKKRKQNLFSRIFKTKQ
jgi:acyl carrier protein